MSDEQIRNQTLQSSVEATIQAGQSALKSSILINGGAAVAILAIIGSLASSGNTKELIPILSCSFAYFIFGTLVATIASGGAYLTQAFNCCTDHQGGENQNKLAKRFHYTTIFLVVVSYVLFCLGAILTYKTFLNLN